MIRWVSITLVIQGKVGQFSVGVDTGVPSVLSSRPNSRGLAGDFLRPSVTWMPRSGEVADP